MSRSTDMMSILKGNLKLALASTFILTDGVVSGDPVLTITADNTPATGEDNAYIKILQKSYTGFPQSSLANATNKDGQPSKLQLVVEESATGGQAICKAAFLARLMHEASLLNVDIELYLSDTTVVPVEAQITAANLFAEIRSDARHPNAGM
jgi:hypothetical protein